jgi:hypothetical protein
VDVIVIIMAINVSFICWEMGLIGVLTGIRMARLAARY